MDNETRALLEALARKELNLEFSQDEVLRLKQAMKQVASTARLAHTIADRPLRTEMFGTLADELDHVAESPAFDVLVRSGAAEILDENFDVIVSQITVDDVPIEDHEFLRECGLTNPADDVTITVTRLRMGHWPATDGGRRRIPSGDLISLSRRALRQSASELRNVGEDPAVRQAPHDPATTLLKKPKKYFNGIGKILSGVVAGTGNVLIGAGAIPATGGAAVAGVIASAALSVGLVMRGIGDLRGE